MNWNKILLSTLAILFILFLFGISSQFLPWGVPTAQVVSASTELDEVFVSNAEIQRYKPGELSTDSFDSAFKGKISTYSTDKTFSWIISTDIENWQPMNYFSRELINLLLVSLFLSLLLMMSVEWENRKRLLLIALSALAGSAAIYGSQLNWWHVPFSFHGGLMLNLLVSWLIASWVSARFILKSERA